MTTATTTYWRRDDLLGGDEPLAVLKWDDAKAQGYSWNGEQWVKVPAAGFLREDDIMRVPITEAEAMLLTGGTP